MIVVNQDGPVCCHEVLGGIGHDYSYCQKTPAAAMNGRITPFPSVPPGRFGASPLGYQNRSTVQAASNGLKCRCSHYSAIDIGDSSDLDVVFAHTGASPTPSSKETRLMSWIGRHA